MTPEEKKEIVAGATIEVMRICFPVILQVLSDVLPGNKALQEYLDEHPELRDKKFYEAVMAEKIKNPNSPILELMEAARKNLG